MLGPAIQVIWSKEILFQAMPVLRFEQFAVKKTELGVMPGLTVNFMRYNNLPIPAGPLVEGVRMRTYALSAQQYQIKVAEHGFAVAVTELLLNASFDDVMASASRLLGRNMALYLDTQARTSLQRSTSAGVRLRAARPTSTPATACTSRAPGQRSRHGRSPTCATFYLTMHTIKDAVEMLASKNIPRLGETYVAFVHPHQSRRLRDTPEFIEVTKYAAPGNFMLGEIGRLNDVVFIETTQIGTPLPDRLRLHRRDPRSLPCQRRRRCVDSTAPTGATDVSHAGSQRLRDDVVPGLDGPGAVATPGWGEYLAGRARCATASTRA